MNWPAENDPNNPDATPALDGWGWAPYWSAQEWLTWHRAMTRKIGVDAANRRFIEWWHKQGFGARPLDARTFDLSFRDYAKAAGFFDALYFGAGVLAKPLGVVSDVSDAASQLGDGVRKTGAVLSQILAPLAVLLALFFVFKHRPKNDA